MAEKLYPTLRPEDRDSLVDLLGKLLQKTPGPVATDTATFDVLGVSGTGSAQALSEEPLVVHAATIQVLSDSAGSAELRAVGGSNSWTMVPGQSLNLTPVPGAAVDLAGLEVTAGVGTTVQVIYSIVTTE